MARPSKTLRQSKPIENNTLNYTRQYNSISQRANQYDTIQDNMGIDRPWLDKARQDKTIQGNIRQYKARPDKSIQSNTRQYKTI